MSDSESNSSNKNPRGTKISQEDASTFSQRITCDFYYEQAFVEYDAPLEITFPTTRAGHTWKLESYENREESVTFYLSLEPGGLMLKNAKVWLCLCRLDGTRATEIKSTTLGFDPLPPGGFYSLFVRKSMVLEGCNDDDPSPDLPEQYRVILEYRGDPSGELSQVGPEAAIAKRNTEIHLKPSSSNVCLSFDGNRKLWVDSAQLCSLSDYFTTCLSSEFQEGGKHSSHDASDLSRGGGGSQDTAEPRKKKRKTEDDFDDSDEETDKELLTAPDSATSGPSFPFHKIEVSSTAFVTYRAVLVWHQTRFIRFAPLTSSHSSVIFNSYPPSPEHLEAKRSHRQRSIKRMIEADPSLPHPVSSKSVYRLADFLSIPELKSIALRAFTSRLTPSNAVHELLSKESASDAYRYLSNQVKIGGYVEPGILLALFEAVAKASCKPAKVTGAQKDNAGNTVAGVFFP